MGAATGRLVSAANNKCERPVNDPSRASQAADAVEWHSAIAEGFEQGYQRSALFKERLLVWRSLVERFLPPGGAVLDAGCGSGVFSFLAAQTAGSVVGFDASPEMIAICRRKLAEQPEASVAFHLASLDRAGSLGDHFDLVLCSSVLEYVDDLWDSIDLLANRLKPGGVLIFSMPNGMSGYRFIEKLAYRVTGKPGYFAHVRHVPTPGAIRRGVSQRRLELLDLRFYGAIPGLSSMARALGLPQLSDSLFVVAVRRLNNP